MKNQSPHYTAAKRKMMVEAQLLTRDITNPEVLDAMGRVPRHAFVPEQLQSQAYIDSPLPIGFDQTISQPYIVAIMTQLLDPKPGQKILEIGTGSGYQAAILAELGATVYSIELVGPLLDVAAKTLKELEYTNVHTRCGDGYLGWPEEAPFDGIIVTAAPPEIPPALVEQLKSGGRMIVPVGKWMQELQIVKKNDVGDVEVEDVFSVRFVPMVHDEAE